MSGQITDSGLGRRLEELAASGWPPRELRPLGSWQLRANDGVTRRANSVLAAGPFPEGDWLEEVERFYRERGLPTCFHVSEYSPPELDSLLAAAGYEKVMSCLLLTASCRDIIKRAEDLGLVCPAMVLTEGAEGLRITNGGVILAPEASEPWLDDFLRMEGFPESRREGYRSIFAAMPSPKAFVTIVDQGQGEPIGVATAVIEAGWAGISNVVVDPRHRRKRAAARMLITLAVWSAEAGAEGMYLQVLEKNAPALELYGKLGFSAVSGYHYRIGK
ncbi:GNAT family N-acetyltransferase [Paenibacillus oralis]|uniref:GNAT family N-acetyltransferase n=1 Tax=Paenibacillus oralis TaxID=2490856 RepID=A0A3P3TZJ1_9BACL|nr:GNAT family N-acetyltransferase [Paenibacillus oralis]RRJ63532.1 GNAT family N-acetyltransferase [Paenibacillus oralis]